MCQCQIPANRVAAYVGHRLSEAAASDLPNSARGVGASAGTR